MNPYSTPTSAPPFPDEFASPRQKEKDTYGLQAAMAMYYSQNRYGYRIFNTDDKIDALFELAQGRASTDNIRRMFGFHDTKGATPDDNGALAYIDIQTINLATTYINRTVAKLQRNKYDINLSAVDPLSVDEAKEMNAKIQTYYLLKDWMATLNVDPQQFFPDMNLMDFPDHPDELMYVLSTNAKIQKVIDGEKTIKLINNVINDTQQVLRECDWDMTVCGRGHAHCYLDENKIPRVARINPKFWLGSYVENEDYSKAEYQAFVEFITKNQFKKESEGKLSKEQIDKVLNSYTYTNAVTSMGTMPEYYQNYDGLEYVPVMRFYFLSNDARAYARWKNKMGNAMIDERPAEWRPNTEEATTEREVIRTNVTSVYGGTWVIDSPIVYDYGRKDIPRTTLVNTRLPIITFAPNMKNGRVVSQLAQMVEPLTMFNVAWNKVKDILAKGRMNVWELNLTAFENVALGSGGSNWTPRQAMDFLFQTNIAVTRQQINQYGQTNGQAVREMASGLQLADYFTTMSQCVIILDRLSSTSVAEQPELPDRLAVGAMKANIVAGAEGIEYLVNGHRQLYHQISHMLLLLAQEAKRHKVAIQGMIPALGNFTTEYFEVPDSLPYCEYGLIMETEPTEEEWIMFYQEVALAVQEGRLNSSDSAFIRMVKNLKQARFIMANRERVNERKAAEMRQQEQKFQMQVGEEADKRKMDMEMAILEKKKNDERELMEIQAMIDDAKMKQQAAIDAELQNVSETTKQLIAKQQGIDTVLKETIRLKGENYKSDKKLQADIYKAEKQADTAMKTAMIASKDKAKKPAPAKK
jgi:hypothetical protein